MLPCPSAHSHYLICIFSSAFFVSKHDHMLDALSFALSPWPKLSRQCLPICRRLVMSSHLSNLSIDSSALSLFALHLSLFALLVDSFFDASFLFHNLLPFPWWSFSSRISQSGLAAKRITLRHNCNCPQMSLFFGLLNEAHHAPLFAVDGNFCSSSPNVSISARLEWRA